MAKKLAKQDAFITLLNSFAGKAKKAASATKAVATTLVGVIEFMVLNDIRRDWLQGYYIAMGAWPKVTAIKAKESQGQLKAGDYVSVKDAVKAGHQPAKDYANITSHISRAKIMFDDNGTGQVMTKDGEVLRKPSKTASVKKQEAFDKMRTGDADLLNAIFAPIGKEKAWTADKLAMAKDIVAALGIKNVKLPKKA